MTSKSDPGGHTELKFFTHASSMERYKYTNFHQNRRGSGTAVFDLIWNDQFIVFEIRVYSVEKTADIANVLHLTSHNLLKYSSMIKNTSNCKHSSRAVRRFF